MKKGEKKIKKGGKYILFLQKLSIFTIMQLQRITPDTGKEALNAIYNNNMDTIEREIAAMWKAIKEDREPPGRKRR